jgi:hypothetical protein
VASSLPQWLYLFFMWPGVIVHEFSHYLGCIITFTKIKKLELFRPRSSEGRLVLGQVAHEYIRNPIKKLIISIAPLFGVSLVIWLLVKFLLPTIYSQQIKTIQLSLDDFSSLRAFWQASIFYLQSYLNYFFELFRNLDFADWRVYIFFYLMLSFGSHAASSKTDLRHAFQGLGIIFVVFVVLYFILSFFKLNAVWQIFSFLVLPIHWLNFILGYGIVFTLLMLILVWFLGGLFWIVNHFAR